MRRNYGRKRGSGEVILCQISVLVVVAVNYEAETGRSKVPANYGLSRHFVATMRSPLSHCLAGADR